MNLAKTKNRRKTINRKSWKNHYLPCIQANRITTPAETYRKITKHAFFIIPVIKSRHFTGSPLWIEIISLKCFHFKRWLPLKILLSVVKGFIIGESFNFEALCGDDFTFFIFEGNNMEEFRPEDFMISEDTTDSFNFGYHIFPWLGGNILCEGGVILL